MKKGFRYSVKFVKHQDSRIGVITRFQVGDKIKDSDNYANYGCTIFGDLDIKDGDRVIIDEIESIDAREYNGKVLYDMVVKAHKDGETNKEQPAPFDL